MELVLVRHAQPEWDRAQQAQVDPGLTELGRDQASKVAARLAGEPFDRLLVSTAVRACETAEPIVASLPEVPVDRRAWMHEIRMPTSWQGTPSDEVGKVLREARHRPRASWWEGMPGGESFGDFHARVTGGLTDELEAFGAVRTSEGLWEVADGGPRLLLVAHAGTNSVILGHLLGLDPEPWEWERFASNHASVTLLRSVPIAGGHIFSLRRFSDIAHLPAEMATS